SRTQSPAPPSCPDGCARTLQGAGPPPVIARVDILTRVMKRPVVFTRYRSDNDWELRARAQHHRRNHDRTELHPDSSGVGVGLGRRRAPGGSVGSVTTNVVPSPTRLCTVISP